MLKAEVNMMTEEGDLIKLINENPVNTILLKLIHHELGNGLAVLSGYRSLLQRAISAQARQAAPLEQEAWQQRNEQCLGYLHIMQDRQMLLDEFLEQLRALSSGVTSDHLCQNFVQGDLVFLLKHVIGRLVPLYLNRTLHVHLPVQSVPIRCDPFWIEVTLEHLVKHTITAHTASTPIDIRLHLPDEYDPHLAQEAKIAIRIKRTLPESYPTKEKVSEMWSHVLNQSDREACSSMCQEILQEHGGRFWREQGGEQEEVAFFTLPLLK